MIDFQCISLLHYLLIDLPATSNDKNNINNCVHEYQSRLRYSVKFCGFFFCVLSSFSMLSISKRNSIYVKLIAMHTRLNVRLWLWLRMLRINHYPVNKIHIDGTVRKKKKQKRKIIEKRIKSYLVNDWVRIYLDVRISAYNVWVILA